MTVTVDRNHPRVLGSLLLFKSNRDSISAQCLPHAVASLASAMAPEKRWGSEIHVTFESHQQTVLIPLCSGRIIIIVPTQKLKPI